MKSLLTILSSLCLIYSCGEPENTSGDINLRDTLAAICNPYDSTESRYTVHQEDSLFQSVFDMEKIAVRFRKEEISALKALYPNSNVRLYVAIPLNSSSDTIMHLPEIVMVATNKETCEQDLDSVVLFSYINPKQSSNERLVPMSTDIKQMLYNWQNLYETDSLMNDLIPFYGNNHTWEAIDSASNGHDLAVQFALKKDTTTDSLTIDFYLTEFGHDHNNQKEFFDFSKPCPRLCGQLGRRQKLITLKED